MEARECAGTRGAKTRPSTHSWDPSDTCGGHQWRRDGVHPCRAAAAPSRAPVLIWFVSRKWERPMHSKVWRDDHWPRSSRGTEAGERGEEATNELRVLLGGARGETASRERWVCAGLEDPRQLPNTTAAPRLRRCRRTHTACEAAASAVNAKAAAAPGLLLSRDSNATERDPGEGWSQRK
ncbi:hypothetical protein MTO96_005699 [Rhipicephalus appendiculatus]